MTQLRSKKRAARATLVKEDEDGNPIPEGPHDDDEVFVIDLLDAGLNLPQAEFMLKEVRTAHRGNDVMDLSMTIMERCNKAAKTTLAGLGARQEEHLAVLTTLVQNNNDHMEEVLERCARMREKMLEVTPVLWELGK